MTKKLNDFLPIFILLCPLIDFITGILTWQNIDYSIGFILKGIFLILAIIYIFKKTPNKKIFLLMGIYFIIYFLYLLIRHMNIILELTNLIKIFYLPILILFFTKYENKLLNKKTAIYLFLFYALLYLVPAIFGLGHNISEIYPNKDLYLSYFYIGNEIINIFIILIPITLIYLIESNCYLLKVLYAILILFISFLLGTKAYYLSLFIIFIYFISKNYKKVYHFLKKNQLKSLLCIAAILAGLIVYIPKMDLYDNIKVSLEHYEIDNFEELMTFENIDHVIYSNRLTFLKNVNNNYLESKNLEKLLGLGREKLNTIKDIEIDIFDIFYSIGLLGIIFYAIFFIYVLKQTKLKPSYKFSFILILIISCFSGHVLMSPMVTLYIALLFIFSKNDNGKMEKDILLVSNMYPSQKNPHYGIFVKNTYELLVDNNYDVDLVTMSKTSGKLNKFLNYVKMCGESLLKSIFNNYNYIYVHFASHTPAGIIIPYLASKNTKFVLNVHGNDIVADTLIDEKYLKLSKIFIHYADQFIAPSKYFKNILINDYNVSDDKIVVYPSGGVNLEIFKKIDKKEAKKEIGLKNDIKYFGYVARLEKDKGYDILLSAINNLNKEKKLTKIKFIIVGSGDEEIIFNELVNKYKIAKYIEKYEFLPHEKLAYIFNSVEAFIYPTRRKSESLGLTGLEALACEALVIGSDLYGPSDYLINNKNSLTFNPNDDLELVKKIKSVLKMKEIEKKKLADSGRKTSEKYSFDKTKSILLDVFKKK